MQATQERTRSRNAWELLGNETIAEFLERVVDVRVRQDRYSRSGYELSVTPQVAADVGGYLWDHQLSEQPEPADGVEYRFTKQVGCPYYCTMDFVAVAYRSGDEVVFEVELV